MAINFLQNVDLNKGEIQNVALQNAGTNPGTPATGQIYFNTGDNTLRVYNGSSWDVYSTTTGDITSVTAGDGLGGGGATGDVTLSVNVDNSSIETNADTLRVKSLGITNAMLAGSIENAKLVNSSITIDGQVTSLGGSVTTDNDDVSNANLLAALANLESSGGAADQNIVIGTDSGDTIVITGNLQVQGTTTTVNSTVVDIADNNITLSSGNATSAPIDGAGITIEGGTGDDVGIKWVAASNQFNLFNGTGLADFEARDTKVRKLTINGVLVTSTAAELNKLDGYTGGVTELNYLDTLHATGVTSTEFDYLDGVTSNIQTQLNGKAASGHAADVGGSTSVAITHNLGTRDVSVQLYDNTTYDTVYADVVRTDTNTVTFNFRTAPAAAAYRCVITRI